VEFLKHLVIFETFVTARQPKGDVLIGEITNQVALFNPL